MRSFRESSVRRRVMMRLGATAAALVAATAGTVVVRPAPAAAALTTCYTWQFHPFSSGSSWKAQVPAYGSSFICKLELGDRGFAVEMLQLSLIFCNNADLSPGWIDGIYGEKTRNAVAWIQGANGLSVDGDYGPLTKNVMQWLYRNGDATACRPFYN